MLLSVRFRFLVTRTVVSFSSYPQRTKNDKDTTTVSGSRVTTTTCVLIHLKTSMK